MRKMPENAPIPPVKRPRSENLEDRDARRSDVRDDLGLAAPRVHKYEPKLGGTPYTHNYAHLYSFFL